MKHRLEEMLVLLDRALKAVNLPDVPTRLEEDHIAVADGVITVTRVPLLVPHLPSEPGQNLKMEVPGWEVLWWTQTMGGPGYYDPPEDIEKELYSGQVTYEAVKAVVLALHEDRLAAALADGWEDEK